MYFFTEQDPNYRIQGSRDPLGFQVIWQRVGKKLIKYLSTVSSNIRDFQTLSYAKYLYGDRDAKGFNEFFLKFEQVCAYARGIYLADLKEGFNGIEFVNKNKHKDRFSISLKQKDTILSNQRIYGILGKYNRPYSEMGIYESPEFNDVMNTALSKTNKSDISKITDRLLMNKECEVKLEELKPFSEILRRLTAKEQIFYRDNILKVNNEDNHLQNKLYDFMKNHKNITEIDNLDFYNFTNEIINASQNDLLSEVIHEIQLTDKVLFTHVAVFRTLQNETSWTKNDISKHTFLSNIPSSVNYPFSNDDELAGLNLILDKDSIEIVKFQVDRNLQVSNARKKSSWILHEAKKFKVYYAEGAQSYENIDRDSDNEFDYFLGSYYRLFKQIEYLA